MNINEINTTNLRIIVGVTLEFIFGVVLMFIMVRGIKVDAQIVYILGAFIIAVLGLGVKQYSIKRNTFVPESHAPPTEVAGTAKEDDNTTAAPADDKLPYEAKDG